MASAKKSELFDTVIVGGHLTGLLVARGLELRGQNVALIDEGDELGGTLRPFSVNGQELETDLALMPAGEESEKLLGWLQDFINEPAGGETQDLAPTTFDSGSFKTFVGFGDRKFLSLNVLSAYNQNRFLNLLVSPANWVQRLAESYQGEAFTRSVLTGIELTDSEMALTLNGAKSIYARRVVYCLPSRNLLDDMEIDLIPGRVRQKMAKSRLWTSVHLHLLHSRVHQQNLALHFLFGSKDDFEPTVGRFFPSRSGDLSGQCSLWMGLLPTELADDSEQIANTLREMKKQIKRAYPDLLGDVAAEKIVVDFNSHGLVDLGLKEFGVLPDVPQMFLAHPTHWPLLPLPAALTAAKEALTWADQPLNESTTTSLGPALL
ncbi:MAG: NAD(P)-binding protein [Bdellovibrionales bacterium]|nr:NAD(P)-binding protein [Bdellovibrionales bacterium]